MKILNIRVRESEFKFKIYVTNKLIDIVITSFTSLIKMLKLKFKILKLYKNILLIISCYSLSYSEI